MKRERKAYIHNYDDKFFSVDTRYYGIFFNGKDENGNLKIKIDPKRYNKTCDYYGGNKIPNCAKEIIDNRKSHYFYVKKATQTDYYSYQIDCKIAELKCRWDKTYRELFDICDRAWVAPEKPEEPQLLTPGGDYKYQCGISSIGAAQARASFYNYIAEMIYNQKLNAYNEYIKYGKKVIIPDNILRTQYSQFILIAGSQLEAFTYGMISKNGYKEDCFNRNYLYSFYSGKTEKNIRELPHFEAYDNFYWLWNFIKHNAISTYEEVKKRMPEILENGEFKAGDTAFNIIRFDKDWLFKLLDGVKQFFFEFCNELFDEKPDEYVWNYTDFFYGENLRKYIKSEDNPLGLDMFDDID
ncbi:MAG: hypothetical protein ACI4VK_00775 [Candidatus Coproplasma sp.]